MTVHAVVIDSLLAIVVLACWMGVAGMLRMRHPTQALHYLSIPATVGIFALMLAVLVNNGFSAVSFKTILIAFIVLAFNSVVAHASARAFRAHKLGHWEPRDGDAFEFVASSHHPAREDTQ